MPSGLHTGTLLGDTHIIKKKKLRLLRLNQQQQRPPELTEAGRLPSMEQEEPTALKTDFKRIHRVLNPPNKHTWAEMLFSNKIVCSHLLPLPAYQTVFIK